MSATIYVEGLSFDYAHFLPNHEKCSRLHGHTSTMRLSLSGKVDQDGMIIDLDVVTRLAREVLKEFDHRLLVPQGLTTPTENGFEISVPSGPNPLFLKLPAENVVLLRYPSTIEHIAETIAERIWERLAPFPQTIERMEVECSEGQEKGARYVCEASGC